MRKLPFVFVLMLLGACTAQNVDLAYKPMEEPAVRAGAASITIDLDIDGSASTTDDRFGQLKDQYGNKSVDYVSNQSITRMTLEAFQSEFRNRGYALGNGPVTVAIWLANFHTNFRMGILTADGNATAGVNLEVLGPGETSYYKENYYGVDKVEHLLLVTTISVKAIMETAFANAIAKAMADEKLFAAILKAHKDAAAQSTLTPVPSGPMRSMADVRF